MEKNLEKYSDTANCPVRNVLSRLGDKWSLLVMGILGEAETLRFGELHKAIGDVSQKMLTATLRTLESDGLVRRTVYAEVPPRVEYSITPLGKSLIPRIQFLAEWAIENIDNVRQARVANGVKA